MKPCDIGGLHGQGSGGQEQEGKQEEKIAEARALHIALRRGD
jgi:hypothetical protein